MTDEELGRVLKALADPNRRRILELLAEQEASCSLNPSGGVNCSMVTEQMTISQPTVSHHMKELAAANLITMTAHGNAALLSLRHDTFDAVIAVLRERFHLSEK
ncbi:MAG: winged helix-turn-helix transcriptional regulator [Akkermansiaceae bacterium]|nr:winged helix-turn-helix transcriptional regulator [Armatimonadota bacterium]